MDYFFFGVALGWALGFIVCSHLNRRHMERMKEIWMRRQ